MGASWVAGSIRARSLTQRRLGRAGARAIASSSSLDTAIAQLRTSPYARDVRSGQRLGEAQEAVLATVLWHLRVLAGWLPRSGAEMARLIAGYWEIANVALRLGSMQGANVGAPFDLGTLGTVWQRVRETRTPAEIRTALAASPWGDPGTNEPAALVSWLRMRWAERVAHLVPGAYAWGAGLLALLVARELFVAGPRRGPGGWPTALLGFAWGDSRAIPEFADRLPRGARWALEGIQHPTDLWRAEARWWRRVEDDSDATLARFQPGRRECVVASAGLLLADAWRTRAALEIADRGGAPLEVFDELA
jgi:hypothetical protein